MNKPLMLKIDYYFQNNVLIKFIVLILIILSVAVSLIFLYSILTTNINISSSLIGIFGTIFGAITGGALAFLGSVYVNNKQIKSKSAVYRKNVIYKPLYDELVQNKDRINESPFPNSIEFSPEKLSHDLFIQYSAWSRIKNDSRFIQTPAFLVDGFNEFYSKAEIYLKTLPNTYEDVQNKVEKILFEKLGRKDTFKNLSTIILTDVILKDKEIGKLFNIIFINLDIDKKTIMEIEYLIYLECNELDTVKQTVEKYIEWLEIQDKLINALRETIHLTNIKHEKLSLKY